MNRNSRGYRIGMDVAGVVASVLFIVRGVMEPQSRGLFLLLGGAILLAVVLRRTVFRGDQ